MTVIITLIIFILVILAVVWSHFLARQKAVINEQIRDTTNVDLYHEHKAEIEQDYAEQKIDQESYQYLLAELDKGLLQDMDENNQGKNTEVANKPMSILWPIAISVFVLVFSFLLYQKNGAFEQLSQPQSQGQQQSQGDVSAQQQALMQQVEQLSKQVLEQPENSELWYNLGQSLVAIGNFNKALDAFDKVIELEGEVADLYGAKAQATYYLHQQKITPAVQQLIDKALALDADDASTNILLGMNAFGVGEYQSAVDRWQRVIDADKPVNVQALTQAINEAKRRLGTPATPVTAPEKVATGPNVTVTVSFSETILEQLQQQSDKTVFIYAQPTDGGRMPLAAVKLLASDLPTTIVLDDSRAMTPQMSISKFKTVKILAVVSMAGTPGVKPGDFKGQLDNVSVGDNNKVNLVIDTLVP